MSLIVYVGSLRPAKIEGVREALASIATIDARFRAAELRPIDTAAVAPTMPMTEAEILNGAYRRAAALADQVARGALGAPGAWFTVGVEGGLDPLPRDVLAGREDVLPGREDVLPGFSLALKTWACVTDGRRWSYGAGGAVVLPDAIAREVSAGAELGDVIDRLAAAPVRGTRGAWGVLTKGLIERRDAFRLAVVSAFVPFYNGDLY